MLVKWASGWIADDHQRFCKKMAPFWRIARHWLRWKLSKWQRSEQLVTKVSSKWQHCHFSALTAIHIMRIEAHGSKDRRLYLHYHRWLYQQLRNLYRWKYSHLYRPRPRRSSDHFAHDRFELIFLFENIWMSLKISLNFVHKVLIRNIPSLVQISLMAWRRQGNKPLSEPVMVSVLTHIYIYIYVTQPLWLYE